MQMELNQQEALAATALANYQHPQIARLIETRGWLKLTPYERIGAVYRFVRDEIPFGYNRSDDLAASEVLADGYGQCNTKGTLLLTLLRGVGIAAVVRGMRIYKSLQKGAIPA